MLIIIKKKYFQTVNYEEKKRFHVFTHLADLTTFCLCYLFLVRSSSSKIPRFYISAVFYGNLVVLYN